MGGYEKRESQGNQRLENFCMCVFWCVISKCSLDFCLMFERTIVIIFDALVYFKNDWDTGKVRCKLQISSPMITQTSNESCLSLECQTPLGWTKRNQIPICLGSKSELSDFIGFPMSAQCSSAFLVAFGLLIIPIRQKLSPILLAKDMEKKKVHVFHIRPPWKPQKHFFSYFF